MKNSIDETLAYYEHNADRYARRTEALLERDALEEFLRHLPAPAPFVLDAACGSGRDLRYFLSRGARAEGFDGSARLVEWATRLSGARVWRADFRMLSLPRESYDGIWAHRALVHLPPEGCQRALAAFFAALKPRGMLFLSFDSGTEVPFALLEDRKDDPAGPARTLYLYAPAEMASLLRQHGFQLLSQGKSATRIALIARRL